MYLITTESGEVFKCGAIEDTHREQWEDGLIDIIDISDATDPKGYYDGSWISLDEYPTEEE